MRLSLLFFISFMSLLRPQGLFSQCMMVPLSLEKRVVNASTIVLGKVVESTPYLTSNNRICTSNLVKVKAYLKGHAHQKMIIVISEGGILEDRAEIVHPALELDTYHEVLLILTHDNTVVDNKYFRSVYSDVSQMETYGSSQGKFTYEDGLFHDLLSEAPMAEEELFGKIKNISGLPVLTPEGKVYLPRKHHTEHSTAKKGAGIYKIQAISSVSPNPGIAGTINAADQITISGVGFGAAPGTVEFSNADDGGGTFIQSPVPSTDIISWTDAQIVMKVPRQAGTGSVRVNGIFTSAYTVDYSHLEINNTFNGFGTSTRQRFYLVNKDGSGGYTFQFNTTFAANLPAVAAFKRALETWRCNTFVNFNISATNTATATAGNDGVNLVFFDATLPVGVLGQAVSSFSAVGNAGCTLQNTEWWTTDIDIRYNNPPTATTTWNYGPGASVAFASTYDFESVSVHELGHAHGLGHIIASGKVMNYALFNGADARVLDAASDIAGGAAKMSYTTVAANYCIKYPGGVVGPMTALTGGNCSLPVSLLSFTGRKISPDHNLLEWVTNDEKNNGGFELQRSSDGIYYSPIAQITPKGGGVRENYSFNDFSHGSQKITYYKLIQMDLNGDKTTFPIVAIDAMEMNHVSMFFDPGDKMVYAVFSEPLDMDSEWVLYNVTGQIVAREKIIKGSYQKYLSALELSSGVYTYSVAGNNSVMRGKIAIQQVW
jgi:hypothetical protein